MTAVALIGCAGEDASFQSADAREVRVADAVIGGSYELDVLASTSGSGSHVLRIPVAAGQGFAAVMRVADDSGLDSYLALYRGDRDERIAVSDYDQALAPMAEESDAVIVHRSAEDGELLLFAADLELDTTGTAQLDLVPLDTAPPGAALTRTDPGLRAVMDALRDHEGEVAHYLQIGALVEAPGGLIEARLVDLPLQERAAVNGLVSRVNDLRELLFERLAEDGLNREAIASLCSALWQGLRSEPHALGRE